jgi:hypothetical protein
MAPVFSRQLASQPGIQVNPIRDNTGAGILGDFDRTAAIVARFPRGRIDKPFRVNAGTRRQRLGKPASVALNALNEAQVHVYEALQRGAREVIVSRLSVPEAAISWAVFTSAATSTFAVAASAPTVGTLGVKHLGCHNDGIVLKVHADTYSPGGTPAANTMVTVKVLDADGLELLSVKGSLTAGSVDEFGESNYLPDVAAKQSDEFEWTIITGASIGTTHDGYGQDSAGKDKYATSANLATFAEGGTGYVATDYDRAITALRNAPEDFGYLLGGGTRAVLLITKLADLAFDTNRQFVFDVPGDLSVTAAIAFVQSLGFGTEGRDHYPQAYYAPFKSLDPLNGNVGIVGTSAIQVGFRCARNAVTNAYGLAKKNQPIAGINGNVGRAMVKPIIAMSELDLSNLADAKINPVWYQRFSGGGLTVFTDTLTCAATVLSYRKLITVAEMSAHIDEVVARYGRECLMLPMEDAIERLKNFLDKFFGQCVNTGWLVESGDPNIPPYAFTVERNQVQQADRIDVNYWLHYDGVARQIHVQQYIV